MLSLTDTAAEAARALATSSGLGPDPGLRISSGEPTSTGTPLEISVAPGPEATDQTVENAGAKVFVGDDVAEYLDDKVLDAEVDDSRVRFRLQDAGGGA